jgi:hypothetical protein
MRAILDQSRPYDVAICGRLIRLYTAAAVRDLLTRHRARVVCITRSAVAVRITVCLAEVQ